MFKDIKPLEEKLSLEDLKKHLMDIVKELDSIPPQSGGMPPPNPHNIRVLMGLGRYGILRDLFAILAGRYPDDNEIRGWIKKIDDRLQ